MRMEVNHLVFFEGMTENYCFIGIGNASVSNYFRLHSLKGTRKGLWAIDVSKNWRITFEFINGNAYVMNYEDYH